MKNPKIPKWIVRSVEVESDFILRLRFADGSEKRYDMKPVIAEGGVFARIATPDAFSAAYADGTSVCWSDEVDIAPEELYENGVPVR
jgi:hypothetical protein